MDKLILFFCYVISCTIVVNILFQFFNDRYIKAYNSKLLYFILPIGNVLIIASINMFMNPILNLVSNIVIIGLISSLFYYSENNKIVIRIFEAEALFMVTTMLEALSAIFMDPILKILQIMPQSLEREMCIKVVSSKLVLLFLYYVFFSRLWKKNTSYTKTQYILYLIMFTYSVINIWAIAMTLEKDNPLVLMVMVGSTILANMYLLYFIKLSDERNYYKLQVEMMEQQEKLQYENYEMQRERYKETITILHDVEKHIKIIEELYHTDLRKEAINYTKQISGMLRPLIPFQYTDNPIMNCLLSDKKLAAESNNISFEIEISTADINFMKPVDITTLFGNLIDNAIIANKGRGTKGYIGLFVKDYKEMISIRIENSIEKPVLIKNGTIIYDKRGRSGVGLLNIRKCVDAYDGNITYKCSEQLLTCDIFLNRKDEQEVGLD